VRLLSPVVWSEGMHLAQHHFQAQSRYFEDLAGFAVEQLSYGAWGLADIGLDAHSLQNGTVTVLHGRGILPDGTPFQFPRDAVPDPLQLDDIFSPTQEAHILLLALPAYDPQRANCATLDGTAGTNRFSAVTLPVMDDLAGSQERPVAFSRKNFRLLLDGTDTTGLVTLPIARIRRDGAGHFVYDASCIPPLLRIGASPHLLQLLTRIVELLDAKADAIAAERAQADSADMAEYATREIAGFWLAHAIHSALAPLRHMSATPATPPETLFAELSRLAGALCTFSLHAHPRDLPLYEHAAPESGFALLFEHIRSHLDIVLPSGAITVALQGAVPVRQGKDEIIVVPDVPPESTAYYHGAITDTRVFGRAQWYLVIRSSAPQAQVAARVPELVKVCSSRFVARLVSAALPGLGIEHVANPPAELGARAGAHYFRLHRTDPCWKTIVATGEVGVYVPAALPDVRVSLAITLEA
jgi:type VI secretion system protein ImpJ